MGLFDSLFGGGGILPPWLAQQPQTQGPQIPQAPAGPGILDRLVSGFQGAANSGTPMAALGNLVGGLATGQRTDPTGAQQAGVTGMLNQLVARGQIDPTTARFLAANPKSWEELSKALINQPITVAPDGSIIQSQPFGRINVPGGVPISDNIQVTNPDGSRSPAYGIRPSLTRPGGNVVVPQPGGGQPPPSPSVQPPPGGPSANQPLLNPNLPNGGRVITEASPQTTSERQAVGGDLAAQRKAVDDRAASATRQLSTLTRMGQLNDAAFEGAAAPAQQFLRSLLTSFGVPSNTVAAGTEFTALSNKLVLDAQNGSLGAGVSNADVQFIANTVPNLSQDAAGRRQVIEVATRIARRDQEVARQAQLYRQQNNGSMDGWQVHIQNWANQNPMFSDMSGSRSTAGKTGSIATPGGQGYTILRVR